MNIYQLLYSKTNDIHSIERLAKEFATCNLYIPKKIKSGHFLSLYNQDFCKALEDNFGGRVIYIPILKNIEDVAPNIKAESILYKIKSLILKRN